MASVSTSSVSAKVQLVNDFTGQTITMKEMLDQSGVSKVTLLKLLDTAGLQPVGKMLSGGRGRPASLFDREAFAQLLANRTASKKVKPAKVEADAVAESDDSDALSVDQINALLGVE